VWNGVTEGQPLLTRPVAFGDTLRANFFSQIVFTAYKREIATVKGQKDHNHPALKNTAPLHGGITQVCCVRAGALPLTSP